MNTYSNNRRNKAQQTTKQEASAEEAGLFLPGVKPVLELLAQQPEKIDMIFLRKGRHGKEMDEILDTCRAAKVRFSLLDPASFARVYTGSSQGVVARLYDAGFTEFDELLDNIMEAPLPLLIALDQVQDPGNVGTLARTAYSLGVAGLIVPRHNGAYLGAGAMRAAAGALEKLPVSKVSNLGQALEKAQKMGIHIYGASAEIALPEKNDKTPALPSSSIFNLVPRLPAVLVLGGEEDGLRQNILKRCDELIHIPMLRDFDSLNVAQAAGIIIAFLAKNITQKV